MANNDVMFDRLIEGLEEMSKESIREAYKISVTYTPSKSGNGAPFSDNIAWNLWRIQPGTSAGSVKSEAMDPNERSKYSSATARDSYASLDAAMNLPLDSDYTIGNLAPYAMELELGGSQVSSRMVATTDGMWPGIAAKAFNKYKRNV